MFTVRQRNMLNSMSENLSDDNLSVHIKMKFSTGIKNVLINFE